MDRVIDDIEVSSKELFWLYEIIREENLNPDDYFYSKEYDKIADYMREHDMEDEFLGVYKHEELAKEVLEEYRALEGFLKHFVAKDIDSFNSLCKALNGFNYVKNAAIPEKAYFDCNWGCLALTVFFEEGSVWLNGCVDVYEKTGATVSHISILDSDTEESIRKKL